LRGRKEQNVLVVSSILLLACCSPRLASPRYTSHLPEVERVERWLRLGLGGRWEGGDQVKAPELPLSRAGYVNRRGGDVAVEEGILVEEV